VPLLTAKLPEIVALLVPAENPLGLAVVKLAPEMTVTETPLLLPLPPPLITAVALNTIDPPLFTVLTLHLQW
jgi:hypothetical protein